MGIPISSLPLANTLTGAEQYPIVQNGTTKRTTLNASGVAYDPAGTGAVATTVETRLRSIDKFLAMKVKSKYVIGITGQSNAVGVNNGGPNPANSLVKTWNGATGTWGGSDYTAAPWSLSTPNGNGGNNNIALALAHRIADETGSEVYIIYDAVGGQSIDQWVGSGTSSARYAAFKTKVQAALSSTALSGITTLDYLIYAQGEEDALTMDFSTYRTKFTTLDTQFRAESWMASTTPMLVMGMSGLHTRYQVWQAQLDYCENVNRSCVYVNSMGLKTQYDSTGSGDYTHWLGAALWEHGYHRAWYALAERGVSHRYSPAMFYARGTGPWRGESDAIALFSSLVSRDSATTEFPFNGPAAVGSISWGYQCNADANYSFAGGYNVVIDNLGNYTFGWGRDLTFNDVGDYSGAFGYQNALNTTYGFAAGRGHTVADSGGSAVGLFSKYTTTQADNVIAQVGVGDTTSNRKNGLTVRKSGMVEICADHTNSPTQNKEVTVKWVSDTSLRLEMRGSDGVVRGVNLTVA